MFRHSCEVCKYTNLQRPSDVTIADFWGWEKTNPSINSDDKGLSLVLCNTPKGTQLFDSAKEQMDIFPVDLNTCMQPNLIRPSKFHTRRNQFEQDYVRKGFTYVMKRYGDTGWRYTIEQHIAKVKRAIKRLTKKK